MHLNLKVSVVALLLGLGLAVQADEISDKGRDVFKKNQKAVVTVQEVVKMTSSYNGRTSEPRESKQDLTGTVIDPSGLTVLALSAADPSEMLKRMYPDYKVDFDISDMKLLLDDGSEIACEIVLRDKDLDLAFIRPKTKLTTPMAAVDFSKPVTAQVLDTLITINRLGRAAGRAHAASVERVSAVVQKPRTFYVPDSSMTATALGSPAFALDGNVVGVIVMRAINAGGGGGSGGKDNATSIILPAEDIAKAALQAPEAKPEEPKKEEAKPDAPKADAPKTETEKK